MGTRNLTCVFYQGAYKIAQYGQWDGYPEGQGKTIYEFLQWADLTYFKNKLKKVKFVSNRQINNLYKKLGIFSKEGFITLDESRKFKNNYPSLDRDMGAEILKFVYTQENILLQNAIDFAGDSLFCEWCYVIDLDKNTFEVYKGYNKEPLDEKERFYSFKQEGEYYPVKLAKSYSLNSLPLFADFLNDFKEKDDE